MGSTGARTRAKHIASRVLRGAFLRRRAPPAPANLFWCAVIARASCNLPLPSCAGNRRKGRVYISACRALAQPAQRAQEAAAKTKASAKLRVAHGGRSMARNRRGAALAQDSSPLGRFTFNQLPGELPRGLPFARPANFLPPRRAPCNQRRAARRAGQQVGRACGIREKTSRERGMRVFEQTLTRAPLSVCPSIPQK